jgi:hypothetical protein
MMVIFFNTDYGIGELNMALLCTDWKNKSKPEVKLEKSQKIEKDNNVEKTEKVDKAENVEKEESEVPYQKFDDEDFEKVLSQMMEMRNMNKNLNDEERRKNAENAILLLSKYLNLDEGELDESDN